MSASEFVKFLYPQCYKVDPKDPKKCLDGKGPATCFSSEDTEKIYVFMEQVCVKIKCSDEEYQELKAQIATMKEVQAKSMKLMLGVK